jgi:hypothetical protein
VSRPAAPARSLWWSWFVAVTAGEFVGFSVPATAGALLADAPARVMAPVLVGAGLVEGAVLGWAQARVLRRALPRLAVGRFVVATAAAAGLCYAVALVPVGLGERFTGLPWPLLGGLTLVLGTVLLAAIGTAQWLVLRAVLPRSAGWVAATAGAWALGLGAFIALTTPLWQPGQPVLLVVAIGLLGGLVMAAVVAALTGAALIRLLSRARCAAPGPRRAGLSPPER